MTPAENQTSLMSLLVPIFSVLGGATGFFTFWKSNLRKIKLELVAEPHVLLKDEALDDVANLMALNTLVVIIAHGPESKWEVINFDQIHVVRPDKTELMLECRSFLKELGLRQETFSRNIPFAIRGGSSTAITLAFQTKKVPTKWTTGIYSFSIVGHTRKGAISTGPLSFEITQLDFDWLQRPDKTVGVKLNKVKAGQ